MATRNRYAEIMEQYQQAQPYSFFGYPSNYTGGYNVAQPRAYAAPVNRYADIMAQPAMGGGRGEVEAPSAFSLMSPAERAAYYRENPIQGNIALGMQDLFGNVSLMGQLAKNFGSGGWYDSRLEKMGVNPTISLDTQNALAGESMQRALNSQSQSQANAAAAQASREAAGSGRRDAGGERGYSGDNSGDNAGWGSRDAGGDSGYAKGGYVSMQRLQGPNPAGPDDGYAALKDGEYVINDQAVNQYGIELMNLINSGKISKGELLGLLEM
jgi:hypothetical protein